MQNLTLETKENQPGILSDRNGHDVLNGASLLENSARILDSLVPLRNASHADAVEYRVEIPMRYAECMAILADGRKATFLEPRNFLGWSSHDARRSLLFRHNDIALEVEIDNLAAERACGIVRSINLQAALRSTANRIKKFIGVDGSQLTLPAT
jgi:malate synthase